jgi:hypothetical protein
MAKIAAAVRPATATLHLIRFSRVESPGYINGGDGWRELDAHEYFEKMGLPPGRVTIDSDFIRVKVVGAPERPRDLDATEAGQPRGIMVVTCAAE